MTTQLRMLRTLLEEGIHAAAELRLERLEELVSQQAVLVRALPPHLGEQAGGQLDEELRELRRLNGIYSRVLLGAARTASALAAARGALAAEQPR